MGDKLIDVANLLISFANKTINIAIEDFTNTPWFNGKDCVKFFGYVNTKRTLKDHVKNENKKQLKDVTVDYKYLYKNVQGHSIYINENGFYQLLSKSNKPEAEEIRNWMYTDVLPTFMKKGHYIIEKKIMKELKYAQDKVESLIEKNIDLKQRNKVLEHNQKKTKYPKGGMIYIKRSSIISDKKINKIGKTTNMNARDDTYNTTVADDTYTVSYIPVDDPDGIEMCLRGMLFKYRYRGKKEFYVCSVRTILQKLDVCIYEAEGKHINDIIKDLNNMERETNNNLDDELFFEFENDDDMDDNDNSDSDNESEIQNGGYFDFELGYYKCMCSNLELILKIKRNFVYNL
jgi:prophage antirepressor-like protein